MRYAGQSDAGVVLVGRVSRFRSAAKGKIDDEAYRIIRGITSSLGHGRPQEAPEACKAVVEVDGY